MMYDPSVIDVYSKLEALSLEDDHCHLLNNERLLERNIHLKGTVVSSSANVALKQTNKDENSHQSNRAGNSSKSHFSCDAG